MNSIRGFALASGCSTKPTRKVGAQEFARKLLIGTALCGTMLVAMPVSEALSQAATVSSGTVNNNDAATGVDVSAGGGTNVTLDVDQASIDTTGNNVDADRRRSSFNDPQKIKL